MNDDDESTELARVLVLLIVVTIGAVAVAAWVLL